MTAMKELQNSTKETQNKDVGHDPAYINYNDSLDKSRGYRDIMRNEEKSKHCQFRRGGRVTVR